MSYKLNESIVLFTTSFHQPAFLVIEQTQTYVVNGSSQPFRNNSLPHTAFAPHSFPYTAQPSSLVSRPQVKADHFVSGFLLQELNRSDPLAVYHSVISAHPQSLKQKTYRTPSRSFTLFRTQIFLRLYSRKQQKVREH